MEGNNDLLDYYCIEGISVVIQYPFLCHSSDIIMQMDPRP